MCVWWHIEIISDIVAQRLFRTKYAKEARKKPSIPSFRSCIAQEIYINISFCQHVPIHILRGRHLMALGKCGPTRHFSWQPYFAVAVTTDNYKFSVCNQSYSLNLSSCHFHLSCVNVIAKELE